jgi:DNA-binding IscR family transcriptional regulator
VVTGNPYIKAKKPRDRIPVEVHAKAAEMLIARESLHQVHRSTGLSKPYISKVRDKLKEDGKIQSFQG